jgi:hypothetical protein
MDLDLTDVTASSTSADAAQIERFTACGTSAEWRAKKEQAILAPS